MAVADSLTETRVKRLTLDVPAELHRALKVRAAELEVPMVELIRALIEQALENPSQLAGLVSERQ